MCDYPFFIPQVVLFANSSLFWFKVTNEHREFRNYLRTEADPLSAFCKTCRNLGYELYEMELIAAGEEFHAAMKRSTNGGGENSPMIKDEDDFYELFFANLEEN